MRRIPFFGAIAAGAAALTYGSYQRDIRAARKRIRTGSLLTDSPFGPIEFAESGTGPAVLVIHGAGGGFDQGLLAGRNLLGDGYRVVAPSRFGYLGTPLPLDASPQLQADAYACVLDALHLDTVPVIGMSAGAPSAMQFALRYPERCSALVLLVPLAYAPGGATGGAPRSRAVSAVLQAVLSSDFLFWLAMRVAHSALVESILGTPLDVYRGAPPEVRRQLDQTLEEILPVSSRAAGLWNEGIVAGNLERYPLEELRVPMLAISAEDDGYRTYEGARYTAKEAGGEFIGYRTGGHLLVGHEEEVRATIRAFLAECDTGARHDPLAFLAANYAAS